MALVLKDRVKVTTTTTGTGAFAIGGAQFGFQGFSGFVNGDTTFYTVVDQATGAWETGVGTYSTSGPTLARTTVLDSSNAGGLVNFGVGPKDMFVSYPAGKAVSTEGNVTMTGPLSVPAGASGAQVPQAQEVGGLANTQLGLAGQVGFFARNTAPTGWLKANGAAVSRTTYAALFAAIGTTFGAGNGSTTFMLPDLRGEFPRGWDDGRGVDSGRAFGSAQADENKAHGHSINGSSNGDLIGLVGGGQGGWGLAAGATNNIYRANAMTTGGSESRPRNIALLACIKF